MKTSLRRALVGTIAIVVSLSVACILHYLVTPQIVAKFEMIAAALKR